MIVNRALLVSLLPVLLVVSSMANADVIMSTFDEDAEGWMMRNAQYGTWELGDTWAPDYHTAGGNPGGYISSADPGPPTFFFEAPAAFLGDLSWAYNGTLTFDRFVQGEGTFVDAPMDVLLVGGGLAIAADIDPPSASWTAGLVVLGEAAGWRFVTGELASYGEIITVLSSLEHFLILGEHWDGSPEVGALDNAILNPGPAGVESSANQPQLLHAWPNPLVRTTTISLTTSRDGHVFLAICDVSGRLVRTLNDSWSFAGAYGITWDATSDAGAPVRPGIYFAWIKGVDGFQRWRLCVLR